MPMWDARLDRAHRGGLAALAAALVLTWAAASPTAAAKAEVVTVEGHVPPAADEHPRLAVRKGDEVAALKQAAATEWGGRVTARLHQALKLIEKLAITGRNREVIKEAGFKAAGYGAAWLLDQDAKAAARARHVALTEIVTYPLTGNLDLMDRISRLHGTAVAYDLCHDAWDVGTRAKVRAWLREEAGRLVEKVGGADEPEAPQPEHVAAHAVAGLAEMAILSDADDKAAAGRIGDREKAVLAYLDRYVGPRGFDANGESVREAAFGSGILEFLRALRRVMGRDWTGHPAVTHALVPMIYQSVPDVGIAVTGEPTATVDRTGLFALGTDLAPEATRPAIAWLFRKVGGEKYLGIVRPHHTLPMLTSGMDAIEPAAPGEGWDRLVQSDAARFVVFRNRWQDAGDCAVVVHDGILRVVGPAAVWVSHRGPHAAMWSHDPGAGAQDNVFLFSTNLGKSRVYDLKAERKLVDCRLGEGADTASFVFSLKGKIDARMKELEVTKRVDNKKVTEKIPLAQGGPFEGARVLGVDYSGRSGAPAVFVVADRLTGGGEVPRTWVLHVGMEAEVEAREGGFTLTGPDGYTLEATVLYPKGLAFKSTGNRPVANFLSANTDGDRVEVVMTVQKGKAPDVKAGDKGLDGKVTVGGVTVTKQGDAIGFSD